MSDWLDAYRKVLPDKYEKASRAEWRAWYLARPWIPMPENLRTTPRKAKRP